MPTSSRAVSHVAALALAMWAVPAIGSTQVVGTFSWQLQPYCNVVTLALTRTPLGFTLDGADDLCGATNRGSAVGVATFNGAGDVTLNFTIVAAPSGTPVHVSAVVRPGSGNGNGVWADSVGNSGAFAFGASTPSLPARPLPSSGLAPCIITTAEIAAGAVGGSDINTAEVQARVTGTCPAGQAVAGVNANGSVTCATVDANVEFRATSHSAQTVTGSTTPVSWANVAYNNGGGAYDAVAGSYTIPSAGLYHIDANASFTSSSAISAPNWLCLYLWNDSAGTWLDLTCVPPSTTAEAITSVISSTLRLNAGTVLQVRVNQSNAGTVSLNSNFQGTHFSVTRLR